MLVWHFLPAADSVTISSDNTQHHVKSVLYCSPTGSDARNTAVPASIYHDIISAVYAVSVLIFSRVNVLALIKKAGRVFVKL